MKRNPPWARDEIILALDLYFKVMLFLQGRIRVTEIIEEK